MADFRRVTNQSLAVCEGQQSDQLMSLSYARDSCYKDGGCYGLFRRSNEDEYSLLKRDDCMITDGLVQHVDELWELESRYCKCAIDCGLKYTGFN